MLFNGFLRFLAASLIFVCAASASAATNDLSSVLAMNPASDAIKNIDVTVANDLFAGDSRKLTSASFISEHKYTPLINVREYFENLSAVSLFKNRDNSVWSLAPSFGKYSANPLSDLKNVQVLLRYKF